MHKHSKNRKIRNGILTGASGVIGLGVPLAVCYSVKLPQVLNNNLIIIALAFGFAIASMLISYFILFKGATIRDNHNFAKISQWKVFERHNIVKRSTKDELKQKREEAKALKREANRITFSTNQNKKATSILKNEDKY